MPADQAPVGGVNLTLVAVDLAGARTLVAAELDAGVAGHVQLDFRLEKEVAAVLLGAEESIRSGADLADDTVALDLVGGAAARLAPAVQGLAIEQRHKALVRLFRTQRQRNHAEQVQNDQSDTSHRRPLNVVASLREAS